MKRIIGLCVASAISISVHANEDADRQRPPILKVKSDVQIAQEREKFFEELEAKRENLNELERLAVPVSTGRAPRREDVLPYRLGDVSRLQAMLRDPEWMSHWTPIAATIAMAADKKAALDLIEFIKDSEAPAGHEQKWKLEQHWNEARAAAIAALGYTLIDQDIPEVLEFLERSTIASYAESLNLETPWTPQVQAYGALYLAATDDAIALLESLLSRKKAEKENRMIQALSVGGQRKEDSDDKTDNEIEMIERYLESARRDRAGISPEPSNEMP